MKQFLGTNLLVKGTAGIMKLILQYDNLGGVVTTQLSVAVRNQLKWDEKSMCGHWSNLEQNPVNSLIFFNPLDS